MMLNCFGCGAAHDSRARALYPYTCDNLDWEEPTPQLCVLELDDDVSDSALAVVVCHECFHKLDPDMWISARCWNALKPHVPLSDLPRLTHDLRWNVEDYAVNPLLPLLGAELDRAGASTVPDRLQRHYQLWACWKPSGVVLRNLLGYTLALEGTCLILKRPPETLAVFDLNAADSFPALVAQLQQRYSFWYQPGSPDDR